MKKSEGFNEWGYREVVCGSALLWDGMDLGALVGRVESELAMGDWGDDFVWFEVEVRTSVKVLDDGSTGLCMEVVGILFRNWEALRVWSRENGWRERGWDYWGRMLRVLNGGDGV